MAAKSLNCPWAPAGDALYRHYHDTEWGVPEYDSRALYEKLILDGFQAGLSWRTILYKRDNFRKAFDGFDPHKIARYSDARIERLLSNEGIIRSRAKIEATIGNARAFLAIEDAKAGGFSKLLWSYVDGAPKINRWKNFHEAPTKTASAEAMSKDLKKLGFKFCGPIILYAFMQATGMVNDHEIACPRWKAVQAKR